MMVGAQDSRSKLATASNKNLCVSIISYSKVNMAVSRVVNDRSLVGRALLIGSLVFAGMMVGVFVPKSSLSFRSSVGPRSGMSAAGILERQLQVMKGVNSEKELNLHQAAGNLYFSQGRYGDAVDHYSEAHKLAAAFGDKSIANVLRDRAEAWLGLGHFNAARADLEEANMLAGETGDASALRCLGTVHREMGHVDAALELYQRSLAVVEASGSGSTMKPLLLANIGEINVQRGKFEEAETLLLEAAKLQEDISASHVQARHSDLAVISTLLGSLYHVQGRVDRAVAMYRQSLGFQSALRADHPEIVATRLGHARAVRDLGDVSVALQLVEQLEWAIHAGAQEGPNLIRVLMLKAELLRQQGLLEEAEQVAQGVVALQAIVFVEDVPDMAISHIVLGNILHDMGLLDEALGHYKMAHDLNMKTVGEDHVETAAALISIGTIYGDLGDNEAAEDMISTGLKIQLRTLGSENPDIGITYNNLAMVLLKRGRHEEASDLIKKALDSMDAAGVPKNHPDRTVFAENLSEIVKSAQDPAALPQGIPIPAVSII